jgi:hypothetical protein
VSDIILFPFSAEKFEQAGVPVKDAPPSVPFGRNIRDKAFFEATIAGEWKKSVGAIVRVCQLIEQAHDELSQAEFDALHLPFLKERAVFAFRRIGKHPVISDPVHHGALPACWRTLDELITATGKDLDRLRTAIADGRIHPDLQRKDVRRALGLPPKPAGSKRKSKTNDQEEENIQEGEAPLDAVAMWAGYSTKDKRAILDSEGRTGLAKLLSSKLMGDLVDHLLGLQALNATTELKRAHVLTALLRNALTADDDTGDEELERLRVKLQDFKLTAADISVAVHRKGRGKRG